MKFLQILGTMTAVAMASAAYAADPGPNNTTEYNARDNGGYHVQSKSDMKTPNGTAKMGEREVDVKVDDSGNVSKTVTSKSAQDPDGLMNEKNQTQKTTYEDKRNGGYVEKSVSEKRNADGTNVKSEVKTDVDVKSDGSREKTVERTRTTDPKGLMNKTKETQKTVNGRVVE